MRRIRHPHKNNSRRGIILLVVLALLTLFLVVGLSFVSYADSELEASRNARDSSIVAVPDFDAEQALAYILGQLNYGVFDDETGVWSSLRGHDFARNIYGNYYEIGAKTNIFPAGPFAANQIVPGLNATPFNGTGRLHMPSPFGAGDEFDLVNYIYFQTDGMLHDPERLGWRAGIRQANGTPIARQPFTGGFNAPYTYPDQNSMFLAAVDYQGNVLQPSFHRNYSPFGSLDPTNPNWNDKTKPYLKYQVMRPRPADHPSITINGVTKPAFPLPDDAGGDVKNLVGGPGGNDSIWIDIGAPVQVLPDGRKYKLLVAPLIIDLDGRINLNVHGNIRGQNQAHASNQGWGKWEINPNWVLTQGTEYKNLFQGNPTTGLSGRYGFGANALPSSGGLFAPSGKTAPFYSVGDINGCNELNGFAPTLPLIFPPFPPAAVSPQYGTVTGFTCFPPFPQGYSGGFNNELQDHPALYNYFFPQGDDRVFNASHMESVLRYGGTNSPALTSDLYRLLPLNMQNPATRRMITTLSMDHDRPGLSPYIWDPADPNTKYTWPTPSTSTYPTAGGLIPGQAIAFPPLAQRTTTPPPVGSDFDPNTWRAEPTTFRNIRNLFGVAHLLNRVDLDRRLTDFPPSTNGALNFSGAAQIQFNQALADRQKFALDIFNALLAITGAQDPGAPTSPAANELNADRWLAQLAVNIVDFIDNDDYSTPFNWFTDPNTGAKQWVFGTELPRIVMNESYIQYDNNAGDTSPTPTKYDVNVWVELHNTSRSSLPADGHNPQNPYPPAGPGLSDDGTAWLQVGANAAYQIVLCNNPDTAAANLAKPDNSTGDPDFGVAPGTTVRSAVTNWGAGPQQKIDPAYGQYTGENYPNSGTKGFYVVGAQFASYNKAPALGDPGLPTTLATTSMTYQEPNTALPLLSPMILLRRLAMPSLPPNPLNATGQPTNGGLPVNPYITIEYLYDPPVGSPPKHPPFQDREVNNGLAFNAGGVITPVTPMAQRASFGRTQPYAATSTLRFKQKPNPATAPNHTFFRHNSTTATAPQVADPTLTQPFDWLVHLDRQLISPMELLQVSSFRPHELTQQFMIGNGNTPATRFQHRAPWFDQSARIYRLFEMVENSDKAASCTVGGRLPGKVNINAIWANNASGNPAPADQTSSIFRAVCDPQAVSNNFTQAQVDFMFQKGILPWRTQSPLGVPGGPTTDRPFLGMAAGFTNALDAQYQLGNGIDRTVLTSNGGVSSSQRTLQVAPGTIPNDHPYLQDTLLTKVFSNVTSRSNAFAVFLTVGFFEVNDDTTRPVSLGAELGRAENRHVRHRMFAIVDRTAMTWFSANTDPASQVQFTPNQGVVPTHVLTSITLNGGITQTDPRTGRQWTIVPGMMLNVDYGGTAPDPNYTGPPPVPNIYTEENVVVLGVGAGGAILADFTKPHPARPNGIPVRCFGNPGPWTRYDPRQDNQVVPYFSIID
jgi:hypothetical protein